MMTHPSPLHEASEAQLRRADTHIGVGHRVGDNVTHRPRPDICLYFSRESFRASNTVHKSWKCISVSDLLYD